jgi:hypothetical protein
VNINGIAFSDMGYYYKTTLGMVDVIVSGNTIDMVLGLQVRRIKCNNHDEVMEELDKITKLYINKKTGR